MQRNVSFVWMLKKRFALIRAVTRRVVRCVHPNKRSVRSVVIPSLNERKLTFKNGFIISLFQTYFEKDEVPMISGISLGVDTSSSGDEGKAAAYIKKIEFLE